jgi:hypothetical protein
VPPYVYALIAHGIIGGIDVLLNHEWLARLPSRPECAQEERLHCAREALFALLFASLAWFEWHGALVWWIVLLFAGEVLVSARDLVVEGDTRVLPVPERVLHLLLFINLGVMLTLTGQALASWRGLPFALVPVHHGWASWVLSVMALGALGWAIRDGAAGARLGRAQAPGKA